MRLRAGWQQRAHQLAQQAAVSAPEKTAAAGTTGQPQISECRVYLASDDSSVAAEIRSKYKHVHVMINDVGLRSGNVYKVLNVLDQMRSSWLRTCCMLAGLLALGHLITCASCTVDTTSTCDNVHAPPVWIPTSHTQNARTRAHTYKARAQEIHLYKLKHACMHTHTRTRTRARARTHTHTHTRTCDTSVCVCVLTNLPMPMHGLAPGARVLNSFHILARTRVARRWCCSSLFCRWFYRCVR
jgi:hypothetical protein